MVEQKSPALTVYSTGGNSVGVGKAVGVRDAVGDSVTVGVMVLVGVIVGSTILSV